MRNFTPFTNLSPTNLGYPKNLKLFFVEKILLDLHEWSILWDLTQSGGHEIYLKVVRTRNEQNIPDRRFQKRKKLFGPPPWVN